MRWVVRIRRSDGVERSWNIICGDFVTVVTWARRRAAMTEGSYEVKAA